MPALSRDTLQSLVARHTTNVCRTMLDLSVDVLDPPPPAAAGGASVLALVGLTGAWCGTGAIACSGDLARVLSGRMLLTEFSSVDADVLDAIGEIANMIIGNVKEDLAADLGPLAINTPTVIHGDALQTRSVEAGTSIRTAFGCDGHVLGVTLSLVRAERPF